MEQLHSFILGAAAEVQGYETASLPIPESPRLSRLSGSSSSKRYSHTSTASWSGGSRRGTLGVDFSAPMGVPNFRDRLEGFLTPLFQDMLTAVLNFVEADIQTQLARVSQRSPGYEDLAPQPQPQVRRRRRSKSDGSIRQSAMLQAGGNRRGSVGSRGSHFSSVGSHSSSLLFTFQEQRGENPQSEPFGRQESQESSAHLSMHLEDLVDVRETRAGDILQVAAGGQTPGSEAPSEAKAEADVDDDDENDMPVCRHWKSKGWCRLADTCKFMHPNQKRGTAALPKKSSRGQQEASSSPDNEDQASQAAGGTGSTGRGRPRRGGRARQRGGEANVLPSQALAPGLIGSTSDQH